MKLTPRALGIFRSLARLVSLRIAAIFPGAQPRPVPHLGGGNHAATNAHRRRPALLRRFLERFPDFESLARARQDEVLQAVVRPRLLQPRAQLASRREENRRVATRENFRATSKPRSTLPGIGRYTAAAVLSIAYDVPLAVLDGNVARVLARLGAVRGDFRAPRRWRELEEIAQRSACVRRAGRLESSADGVGRDDLHAANLRAAPRARFRARAAPTRLESLPRFPLLARNALRCACRIAAAILRDPRGRTILVRDPGAHDHVLFSRMWQFPAIEVARQPQAELERHLRATLGFESESFEALPEARHGVTFRSITLLPFLARVAQLPKRARTRVIPLERLGRLPVSSATRKLAQLAISNG